MECSNHTVFRETELAKCSLCVKSWGAMKNKAFFPVESFILTEGHCDPPGLALGSVIGALTQADSLQKHFYKSVCSIPYGLSKPQDYWSKYLHFSHCKYMLVQPSLNTDIFLTLHFFNLNSVTHEVTFLCPKVTFYLAHLVINWWVTIPMDTTPCPWTVHLLPAVSTDLHNETKLVHYIHLKALILTSDGCMLMISEYASS